MSSETFSSSEFEIPDEDDLPVSLLMVDKTESQIAWQQVCEKKKKSGDREAKKKAKKKLKAREEIALYGTIISTEVYKGAKKIRVTKEKENSKPKMPKQHKEKTSKEKMLMEELAVLIKQTKYDSEKIQSLQEENQQLAYQNFQLAAENTAWYNAYEVKKMLYGELKQTFEDVIENNCLLFCEEDLTWY